MNPGPFTCHSVGRRHSRELTAIEEGRKRDFRMDEGLQCATVKSEVYRSVRQVPTEVLSNKFQKVTHRP